MDTLLQDVRYAVRTLMRSPGFALVAVLTLALGIGANTALFTILDGVFVRPAPGVNGGGRLVWVAQQYAGGNSTRMSLADLRDYRAGTAGVMEELAAYREVPMALGGDVPERIRGEVVTGNYFTALGVRPTAGRLFTGADDRTSAAPGVVVSHALWTRKMGGDPAAIGRDVVLDGQHFTLVGVAPAGFYGPALGERVPDAWVPVEAYRALMPRERVRMDGRGFSDFAAIGRLREGADVRAADAAVATVARRLEQAFPVEHDHVTASVSRVHGSAPAGNNDEPIFLFALGLGVTGIVLLIACANVANLLLGRAAARRREIGIRLAMGAGRTRLVRQLLTESVLLAALGAGAGLWVTVWATGLLLHRLRVPIPLSLRVDGPVLAATGGLALVTALLFGLLPALQASSPDVLPALRDGGAGAGSRSKLQRRFAAAQVALSLVLLVCAGLMLRSLGKAGSVDLGFTAPEKVLAVSHDLATQGYSPERAAAFGRELLERARAVPGVRSAALATSVPFGETWYGNGITLPGHEKDGMGEGGTAFTAAVSPGFFRTLGVALAAGRDVADADRAGTQPVAVVNETMARRWWAGESAVGKHFRIGGEGPDYEVVGVARDYRYMGLSEPIRPFVYLAAAQAPEEGRETTLLVRADDPAKVAGPLRQAVREMDPALPVYDVRTLAGYVEQQLEPKRAGGTVLTLFGGLALMLAALGVYGVMAYSVAQRTREIGVRVALGARAKDVMRHFVGEGARLAAWGIGVGTLLAAGVTRLLSSVLLGVTATDFATFAGVALLLAAAAVLASWIPARRAMRVDPMVALRQD
ncbi:MAG TPA: ABC transporter permease [Longimicrobiaceae bacterium]|jgi:predicted permease|nr:ABC transporter permease [Longimicrobiaceae bacterium]